MFIRVRHLTLHLNHFYTIAHCVYLNIHINIILPSVLKSPILPGFLTKML
jgi:hypothetical protein